MVEFSNAATLVSVGTKTIMIKGEGFAYVWKEIAIMLGMTAFFLALSVKKFKVRLE